MELFFDPTLLLACLALAMFAGLVKGMVGFAMPMILISGLSSLVPPDLALAGLILPTLVTNAWQGLRGGPAAAWAVVRQFRLFLLVAFVALMVSAQLVRWLPAGLMLGLIGGLIVLYAASQLLGRALVLGHPPAKRVEIAVAALAGGIGGVSGVWGPPTVAYLTALETPKGAQVRIQGVIYGLGALSLLGAHLGSGVLNAQTLPFSLVLVPAALAGMGLGFRIHDRIEQALFRRLTLAVLLIAGLNLLRRALMG
ncbi:sulfite exporter TauE/SafE family protein [Pseudooceanicola sp. CBS1P-1]|uniref:Probable membrane transporter protein n=1 Tax=Pseudooceanicola albus TaxID=2692189 RepID=A0A6L7G4X0_9RHOB|nr:MULTISPECIES: sulfite exporter TauE/SafE family protein [Pseudooceanicola]MBT9384719.1 sulfite exporter TauE/SafE family protein [Pseudooceanicola endophyticus]MXN18420.1 TSUP family transporter [Pseudooceanicola albus]